MKNYHEINKLIEAALMSQATWVSMSGTENITFEQLSSLFKWPDIVRSLMEVNAPVRKTCFPGEKSAEDALIQDLYIIIMYPLNSITKAYVQYIKQNKIAVPTNIGIEIGKDTTAISGTKGISAEEILNRATKAMSLIRMLETICGDMKENKDEN